MSTQPNAERNLSSEMKLEKRLYKAVARADRLKSINSDALALLRAGCIDLAIKDLKRGQSI